jgi:hypothetical protein
VRLRLCNAFKRAFLGCSKQVKKALHKALHNAENRCLNGGCKWDLMVILYDNDEAGILHADKMVKKYGIKSLILPESDTKDPSDFVKKYDLSFKVSLIKTVFSGT